MKKLLFRPCTPLDGEALALLMKQLGYPIEVEAVHKNIVKYSLLSHQKAWVSEEDGKVVGCIAFVLVDYFHRESSFLRITTMIVDQKKRRRGIGKKLMQLVENYAKKNKCSHIELTSGAHRKALGAHEFYASLGYANFNHQKKYFGKKLD